MSNITYECNDGARIAISQAYDEGCMRPLTNVFDIKIITDNDFEEKRVKAKMLSFWFKNHGGVNVARSVSNQLKDIEQEVCESMGFY